MFIRTQRLFLRPAWAEDAPAVARAIGHLEIVRNLGRAPWPYTLADAEAFVGGAVSEPQEASFLIFWRDPAGTPMLAGSIGFGRFLGPDHEIEIGYWLGRDFQRRGIAAEAGRAVLELVFEGLRLPRIAAGHFVDNPASGKVLSRLGFRPTGEVISYPCRARGREVESVEYALTAAEWRDARQALKEAA